MSAVDRQRMQSPETEGTAPKRAEQARGTPAGRSYRLAARRWPQLPAGLWQGGNGVVNAILGAQSPGRPLAAAVCTDMEEAFDTDFTGVQVHDDLAASQASTEVDARAFTHGEDVCLGVDAPALASGPGQRLLAHELAHVVQQQGASAPNFDGVGQPHDRFEQAADKAAQRAVQGKSAEVAIGGITPAVQYEGQARRGTSRLEAQRALEAFLRRELAVQGGHNLRITPQVRNAVEALFVDDVGQLIAIQAWLGSTVLPGNPSEFARHVARRLPDEINPERIQHLATRESRPEDLSRSERVEQFTRSTAPGSPDLASYERYVGEQESGLTEPRIPTPRIDPAGEERRRDYEESLHALRRASGVSVSPIPIDIPRLVRISSGLPVALHGPSRQADQPQARTYPEVEQVIEQISTDALVPTKVRGDERADEFADSHEVARDLASRLDVAAQQGQERIDLRLGDDYNRVQDPPTMIQAVQSLVQLIRDALPHHAANARYVDIYFGDRLVDRFETLP